MKFVLLIYNDPALLDALPKPEFDSRMRHCLEHADELKEHGKLLDSQILGPVGSSRVDLQACKLEYSIVSPK